MKTSRMIPIPGPRPPTPDTLPGGVVRERDYGVVDIGSNTVHLLVARTNGATVTPLVDLSEGLRLGDDVDSRGAISDNKIEQLIDTLSLFREAANVEGITAPHLLATHAIRTAANRAYVTDA